MISFIELAQSSTFTPDKSSTFTPDQSSTFTSAGTTGHTFAEIVNTIVNIVNRDIIPVLFVLGFLFFMAGIARYFFFEQASEESQEKGKQFVIAGVVGFVVLFAIWGIVNLLLNLLTSTAGVSATS